MVAHVASALSDYRFCLYRLNVLRSRPNPDRTAIAAVMAHIERLVVAYPEIRAICGLD
jgi:hypothetical protein